MWLFPYFFRETARAAFSHVETADSISHQQESKLTTYCQLASIFPETYPTSDVIAEAEANIKRLGKTANMTAVSYTETLWEKALSCTMVYNEPRMKRIITECLCLSICYSTRTYWGAHNKSTLHSVAHHKKTLWNYKKTLTVQSSPYEKKLEADQGSLVIAEESSWWWL